MQMQWCVWCMPSILVYHYHAFKINFFHYFVPEINKVGPSIFYFCMLWTPTQNVLPSAEPTRVAVMCFAGTSSSSCWIQTFSLHTSSHHFLLHFLLLLARPRHLCTILQAN
ncbi:hypothetical protein VIGAN_03084300 [Vigna angularis var. angularis]|uniref:Uncharacterized protein n=1 Tax=Vigna angularis var. angularis TaxID=157739 RepID=A0A0S3RKU7_PHAAN|nr:hypothetical protein VIGAN_03084300 [Vigna angularis var. angularis]